MTESQARTAANVVLAAAAIAAVYYVWTTPKLRRMALQTARAWAGGPLPAWVATEVRRAWDESGRTPMTPARAAGHGGSALV